MGFEVRPYNDLTYQAIEDTIDRTAKDVNDFACDCILVTVLSYGTESSLYAHDKEYPTQILWNSFTGDKCPGLAGKPKIFIIQVSAIRQF